MPGEAKAASGANNQNQEPKPKFTLPVEPKLKIYTRFVTYLVFFITIFAFGLPIWYNTTSITRESLMVDKMIQYEKTTHDNVKIQIPIYVNPPANTMDSLIQHAQSLVDANLAEVIEHLGLTGKLNYQLNLINNKNQPVDALENYVLNIRHSEENRESLYISPISKEITVFTSDQVIASNHVADFIAKVLVYEVFKYELELYDQKTSSNVIFDTAANYHLSFFLLNGDGDYVSWEFKDFYQKYLVNFIDLISRFSNFTIDSQIEYYSTLSSIPQFDEATNAFVLHEDDTSIFVNHEKWNLDNNVLIPPTNDKDLTFINLILYIPSKEFQPLLVENSKTNSFITPQYGGIQILNLNTDEGKNTLTVEDLKPIFETFTSQIFTLLGLPKQPKSPYIRVDFLTRYFIINNLRKSTENLGSLVRLIHSLPSISIPNNTQKHVTNVFNSIDESIKQLNGHLNLTASAHHANQALVESNLAFFEKEMVQQIYFPEEHKFAVYSPLLGPIFTILFLGFIRITQDIKALRKSYKKKEF